MREFVSLNNKNIRLWFLMSFQAGAINAGAFLACKSFATHTTGFATLFGVGFAQGHYFEAFGMLTVPLFFLLGSMITARFVELPLSEGHPPDYRIPCAIIIASLLLTMGLGLGGYFGAYLDQVFGSRDFILLILLCLASGLQNALASNGKGTMIRTSHMTGNTTDLAVSLVRIFYAKQFNIKYTRDWRITNTRAGIIICFILGSLASAYFFQAVHYFGFLLPLMSAVYLYYALSHQRDYHVYPRPQNPHI